MPVLILVILFGWASGVIVNYLADVLPRGRKLVRPFCIHCRHPFRLVNYFLWPRRCASCGQPRSLRVWVVEAVMAGAAVWLYLQPPNQMNFLLGMALLIYFGVVVVIDLEHKVILHQVSIAGAILGLIAGTLLHGIWITLLGGIIGYGLMLALYALGVFFVRVVSKRRGEVVEDALGYGDVNLVGVLGLILGWPLILAGLMIAVILGGFFSLLYMLMKVFARKYEAFEAIPYGPFLVAGAVILIFFMDGLLSILS